MSPSEYLHERFDIRLATSEDELLEAYRLRYQVYCEENGYLEGGGDTQFERDSASGIERDEFDARSVHCLITHRATQIAAGHVRLVTAYAGEETQLPMERYCYNALSLETHQRLSHYRQSSGEISRLAVVPHFRDPANDDPLVRAALSPRLSGGLSRQSISLVTLTASVASLALADYLDVRELYAMMSPSLYVLLRRSGVDLTKCGIETDYYGRRIPLRLASIDEQPRISAVAKEIYDFVTVQLRERQPGQISAGIGL